MARLGDICTIQSGGTPSRHNKAYWDDGTIPWVKISDIKDKYLDATEERITKLGLENSSAKIFPAGTILYTIFATLGEVCILNIEAATNQAISGIQLESEQVDKDYLYHYLSSLKSTVNNIGRGVAQNNINMTILRNFEIPLPSLEEQRKIAAVLDKVCDLIAKRRTQLDKLDELVKSRFVEMFGDVIQNTKLWPQYVFSDITTSRLGKMLDAKQQTGMCQYPYLANFNVQWFRFELNNLNEMDFNESDRVEFELRDGDLLVCEGGEIGRCAVWHNEIQSCYFQKALHRVRCKKEVVLPDYLAWWFKYNCDNKGFAAIEGAKATISHLPGAKLKALLVSVPPIELQNQFAAFVKQTKKTKSAISHSLQKLETLKKALMQEYFG